MTKKRVLKTRSLDQGIPGVPLDQAARLDGPRTSQPYEFEEDLGRRVAEVRAKEVGFRDRGDGLKIRADLVPSVCTHCHAFFWVTPDKVAGPCTCYYTVGATEPWQRRAATKAEMAAWSARQKAAQAQWAAGEPARRAALQAANRRRNEDDPDAHRPFINDPSRSVGRA